MLINNVGIWGTDVSKWQSDPIRKILIDFKKMKDAGCSFVIPKIGQYNYYDYDSDNNWKMAKEFAIARGSYWFLDYREKGKPQAQKYFDFFDSRGDLGEGIHFVDYENGSGGEWQKVYDFIVEFQRLSGLPNHKIGVYSAYYYWIENSPLSIDQRNWFAQYPYWHAWYINNAPKTTVQEVLQFYKDNASNVKIPPQWVNPPSPVIWQAGTPAIGKMLGAQSAEIDFNLFNGDAKLFEKYFGTVVPTPPVEEPQEPPTGGGTTTMHHLIVLAEYLNGRSTPSSSGALVFPAGATFSSGFRKDDVLEADITAKDDYGVDWYRITKCTRNGANVQLPNPVWASAGATYSLMRLYTPETPQQETPPSEIFMKFSATGQLYRYVRAEA
jgi:hypothetical protein